MSYLRSSLPPVVCRRAHVLFTLFCVCLVRLYLQLFVGGLMSYLHFLCLFGSSSPPVVCRRAHVLFTLFVFVCSCLYLQLFVGGLMSYLRLFVFVWFVFTSSCL